MKTEIAVMTEEEPDLEAIKKAGEIIRNGGLVAFPTETVYGLGGDAKNAGSSRKIYAAKGRPSDNPLIVHIARMEDLYSIVSEVPEMAERLAEELWPGPLTMIFKKNDAIPEETTGGLDTVAVRFPSGRIARELIKASGGYIAAPSANLSGRPSTTKAAHVITDMDGRIDMIIDGGDCRIGLESTIVDVTGDVPVILRPGFYSGSRLEKIVGNYSVDPAVKGEKTDGPPKAPGMKYRHYAPKAELILVEGPPEAVVLKISELLSKSAAEGVKAAVICSEETKDMYKSGLVYALGSRNSEEEIAHSLFDVLRQTDDAGAEIIYSETFDTPLLGKAIMNRLFKAAGFNIIRLQEERSNDSTRV